MSKSKYLVVILVLLLLLGGGLAAVYFMSDNDSEVRDTIESFAGSKCGDGICGKMERTVRNCPADCPTGDGEGTKALNLGMMVHLEGWFGEETSEVKYNGHVTAIRNLADKLEEYDAVGTFEASPETVEAAGNWSENIMLELYERGHGIGVHADVGGNPNSPLTLPLMVKEIKDMRIALEELIGADVRHVSGICSHLDWADAAIKAGYEFNTGLVAYCVSAMDYEDRPDEYKDCTNPSECHDVYPHDLEDRVEPWRVGSAKQWLTHDPNGDLVIIMEAGGLYGMNEEFGDGTGDGDLTSEDVTVFIEQLDQAIALMENGEVNTFYVSWSIGNALRVQSPVLDEWLQAIESYVEAGQVEWKSIPDMYDNYVANE